MKWKTNIKISKMKKNLYLILSIFLLLACEDEQEKDCFGVAGGAAVLDNCNQCVGGDTGLIACTEDCNGDFGGTAVFDDCDQCVEGNTGEIACMPDCNGDLNGDAYINPCDICVGGNTDIAIDHCDPVIDIDGNVYQTIIIGEQAWMMENLKVTKYRDGTSITDGSAYDDAVWGDLSSGAFSVNNQDTTYADTYGLLYNWYAVDDSKNIAPEGWHVPTHDEWTTLERYICSELGGHSNCEEEFTYDAWADDGCTGNDEGEKMKAMDSTWLGSLQSTNESGFSALPAGLRRDDFSIGIGITANFYTSTKTGFSDGIIWYRKLSMYNSMICREYVEKMYALSVRCIKD